jgi:hypothetical protein
MLTSAAHASLITFENNNFGVAAVDNRSITNEYSLAGAGQTFYRGAGNNGATIVLGGLGPFLEMRGSATPNDTVPTVASNPEAAYNGSSNPISGSGWTTGFNYNPGGNSTSGQVADNVATGPGLDGLTTAADRVALLGDYFLRTTSFSSESMVVTYTVPVIAASFEIWDIDGNPNGPDGEQWRVRAYNGNWTTPVIEIYSPYVSGSSGTGTLRGNGDLESYDAQGYVMNLSGASFDRFIISFEGESPGGVPNVLKSSLTVGLAFNNFNTVVPEPGTVSLVAVAGAALLVRRRRSVAGN